MSYDKKCPRFVDPVRGWVNSVLGRFEATVQIVKLCACPFDMLNPHSAIYMYIA